MTSPQAVYRKSAKGIAAIAIRQAGMAQRLRSALIMVDGKRGFEDLSKVVAMLGDAGLLLAELETAGLIELVSAVAATPAPHERTGSATAAHSTSPAESVSPATLAKARQVTSRLLTQLLGPTSEALCLKIEASRDMPAFVAAVKRARDIVRDVKGQAAAARFIEQVEAHTPGA